jgi:low temperature requirement protein LtrA
MRPRSIHQAGRVSTPLELLFDLTFVVAVGSAVQQLAAGAAGGGAGRSLISFAMVFFSIWWAWMSFTWFASSYDVDDAAYRLLVMIQMAGVLILAAGVDKAFTDLDWTAGTIGYVVMRAAQIGQWARAGLGDPPRRPTAKRYVLGIGLVQIGWLARLALPRTLTWTVVSFGLLAAAEMVIPAWAEPASRTPWHPHHIAERYGLFTLILLGELVAVAAGGVQVELDSTGLTVPLAGVSAAALVLLFALWWLYFISPIARQLERRRQLAFVWGYGHATIFLTLAILGAGLYLAVEASHESGLRISLVAVGYLVCAPVALFIAGLWALDSAGRGSWRHAPAVATAVLALLAAPWLGLTGLGAPGAVAAAAVITVAVAFAAVASRGADHTSAGDVSGVSGRLRRGQSRPRRKR